MNSEKFNLKWNDFESSISGSFRDIKDERDFQDVTLACEEDQIGVIHSTQLALELCISYFRGILEQHRQQNLRE